MKAAEVNLVEKFLLTKLDLLVIKLKQPEHETRDKGLLFTFTDKDL
jgi:hypothetical protein